jgi:hypothetical protein
MARTLEEVIASLPQEERDRITARTEVLMELAWKEAVADLKGQLVKAYQRIADISIDPDEVKECLALVESLRQE